MKNKTVFISGGSRGIGKAVAVRLGQEGANVVIAAKTTEPHPKLPGTIYSAAEEIVAAGGQALPLIMDIRSDEMVEQAVEKAVEHFGGIDVLINNASAIGLTQIEDTSMKRYDLMHDINVRGTFLLSKTCIPHLRKSDNGHILTFAPPLNLDPQWFGAHLAYTMSKYAMAMTVLGQAHELKKDQVASNALWPATIIATAAVQNIMGGDALMQMSRKPEIMAEAALQILQRESSSCSGNFFIDEEVLRESGVEDFSKYAVNPAQTPMKDLFL